jgi:hypothetical protein
LARSVHVCHRIPSGRLQSGARPARTPRTLFGIITRQAIRRGTFTSVRHLIGAIETFIDAWNETCEPFTWTKTADDILTKANRQKISDTRH